MSVQVIKTGVINASGLVNPNLFRDTALTSDAISKMASNSSTTWTVYFRRYNGSNSIHTFSDDGTDTILLNSASNLGICFQRKATDINLDPNSYYTMSCEAKCNKSGAKLAMGASYYDTSDAWHWAGSSNQKTFTELNTWLYFSHTFKPASDTQYIDYNFCVVGSADGTETFSIRHCKLEKGEIATPWIPNELDSAYAGEYNGFNESKINVAQFTQNCINSIEFIEM